MLPYITSANYVIGFNASIINNHLYSFFYNVSNITLRQFSDRYLLMSVPITGPSLENAVISIL